MDTRGLQIDRNNAEGRFNKDKDIEMKKLAAAISEKYKLINEQKEVVKEIHKELNIA